LGVEPRARGFFQVSRHPWAPYRAGSPLPSSQACKAQFARGYLSHRRNPTIRCRQGLNEMLERLALPLPTVYMFRHPRRSGSPSSRSQRFACTTRSSHAPFWRWHPTPGSQCLAQHNDGGRWAQITEGRRRPAKRDKSYCPRRLKRINRQASVAVGAEVCSEPQDQRRG
jgi:hypothetical protein